MNFLTKRLEEQFGDSIIFEQSGRRQCVGT
jgi:hypothetical protein